MNEDKRTVPSRKWGAGSLVRRNGLWYARYYSKVAEKQVMRGTGCRDQRAAEQALKRLVEADRAEAAGYVARKDKDIRPEVLAAEASASGPALRDLLEGWLADSRMSDKSKVVFRGLWRHLEAFAKTRHVGRAGQVDRAFAEAFYSEEQRHFAPSTAKTAVALPRWIWRWALDRNILTGANPWLIRTEAGLSTPHPTLTAAEVQKLLDAAQGDERLLIQLGINTGMRISDAAGLRWASVDLSPCGGHPCIHFLPIKTARHHKQEVRVPLLDQDLVTALKAREAAREQPDEEYVFPAWHDSNRPFDVVRSIFDRAGVKGSFHSLRHTFVTRLREKGVSLEVIAAMTGHSQTLLTWKYGGTTEQAKVQALSRVSGEQGRRGELLEAIAAKATTEQLEAFVRALEGSAK